MEYLSVICSDIGISKKVNQDAAITLQAATAKGNVLMAVVCDGMGGLSKGEIASSTVITEMQEWFEDVFPDLLYRNFTFDAIKNSWMDVMDELNERIRIYGEHLRINLGTTLTALLLVDDAYYICNIGDSRVYYLKDGIRQMTRDQSFVQQEIDVGRMTEEEAAHSDKRSVLLQCIGVGESVIPDFYSGEYSGASAFLLCSDGFRHVISNDEIWNCLDLEGLREECQMEEKVRYLIDVVKNRGEEDNITAVLVSVK
ncbi:MAG: protein phosphatase 2C domain-containing protein [Lachnospiraceae bacterium]|nr:protein phosphatase 2C domain-containing protein [Lachnospiraceae bacterium]